MPGFFYQPLGRRQFIRYSAQALAACSLTGAARAAAGSPDSDKSLHLALLSDLHVAADPKSENRKFNPWENLQRVVAEVRDIQPHAVFVNGDLARQTGEPGDYEAVRELLAPLAHQYPIHLAMGNHDNRENFSKVFTPRPDSAQKVPDKYVLVVEEPFLRIVVLDSLLYVNKVSGLLGKAQRDWLDRFLAKCDARPTIVLVHHTLGDGDGDLLDAEAFYRITQPYGKVKAIFYGHSHEYSYKEHQGIHLINLPAVGYNFSDKEPVGWVDAFFTATGAELTLKAFGGNRVQDGKTKSLRWRSA